MSEDLTRTIAAEMARPPRRDPRTELAIHDDGLAYEGMLDRLAEKFHTAQSKGKSKKAEQFHGLFHRNRSMANITPRLHQEFGAEAATMANWLPALVDANEETGVPFDIPHTQVLRLDFSTSALLRKEFAELHPGLAASFNQALQRVFGLVSTEEVTSGEHPGYFIKTGTFSSKFEFANAHLIEPDEIGDYFRAIDDMAQQLGAGETIDLVVREWIEPADPSTPTIYHGMPLRTEFRAFIDLGGGPTDDDDQLPDQPLLGITPYWHPIVMERALSFAEESESFGHIRGDYETYLAHRDVMIDEFHRLLPDVAERLNALIPQLRAAGMRGAHSFDVMANTTPSTDGDPRTVLYAIDMAPMHTSALTELLSHTDEYAFASPERIEELAEMLFVDESASTLLEDRIAEADSLSTSYLYDSREGTVTAVDLFGDDPLTAVKRIE